MPIKGAFSATVPVSRWQSIASRASQAAQQYAWRNKYAIGAGLGLFAVSGLGVGGMRWYNQKKAEEAEKEERKTRAEMLIQKYAQRQKTTDPQAANKAAFQAFIDQKMQVKAARQQAAMREIAGEQKENERAIFDLQRRIERENTEYLNAIKEGRMPLRQHAEAFDADQQWRERLINELEKPIDEKTRRRFCAILGKFHEEKHSLSLRDSETYQSQSDAVVVMSQVSQPMLSRLNTQVPSTLFNMLHPIFSDDEVSPPIYAKQLQFAGYRRDEFDRIHGANPREYDPSFFQVQSMEDFAHIAGYATYDSCRQINKTLFGTCGYPLYWANRPERYFEGLLYKMIKLSNNNPAFLQYLDSVLGDKILLVDYPLEKVYPNGRESFEEYLGDEGHAKQAGVWQQEDGTYVGRNWIGKMMQFIHKAMHELREEELRAQQAEQEESE